MDFQNKRAKKSTVEFLARDYRLFHSDEVW